jgi:hypothetical protein
MVLHRLKDRIYTVYSSQFDLRVQNWCYPLYIRPYIPSLRSSWKPNSYLSFRSTHTRRIRSITFQCSRLVAREWRSSWAHAQVSDLVLEARQSLVSSLLHLLRLIINLSYSYLHGYAYFEYISRLFKVIITFVWRFIERLVCYSLSIGLSSRASYKHSAYTMLFLWVHLVLWLCGSSEWWQSCLSVLVHAELNRFLNCRTVIA